MGKVNKRRILFSGLILLSGYLAALGLLFLDYDSKVDSLREETISRMDQAFSAITGVYEKFAELAFAQDVHKPEFLELYSTALTSTHPGEKSFWRGVLSDRLGKSFEKLAFYHIRTLHLIEPDGTIFLRVENSGHYGDNVLSYSPLQRLALSERKPVHGFQEGRTDSLYRYSFPLFFGNTFLGSAEFGLSALAITEQLNQEMHGNYTLLLRKDLVKSLTLPTVKDRYIPSELSDRYLEHRLVKDEPHPWSNPGPEEQKQILEKVSNTAQENLAKGESFLLSGRVGSFPYEVVFLQLKTPGRSHSGYLVASMKGGGFERLRRLYAIFASLLTGLFLLSGALVTQWWKYHQKLVDGALFDSLTGGLKQGSFDDIATRESSRAQRYGLKLSLVLFDLDHFKTVNDRWGHLKGDVVLAEIGKAVRQVARQSDYFFRWGGDEFLLVLPGTDIGGAISTAEKIRLLVENLKPEGIDGFTMSAGVAQMEGGNADLRAVLNRADEALYRAKAKGRNNVSD